MMLGWAMSRNGTIRYHRRIDAVRYRIIIMACLKGLPMPYQQDTEGMEG